MSTGRIQPRLYFEWRLVFFNIYTKLLQMLYQSMVSTMLLYFAVCWGSSTNKRNIHQLNKNPKRQAGPCGGRQHCRSIMDNTTHPLHSAFIPQRRSTFSTFTAVSGLLHRKSFVRQVIRLHNRRVEKWAGS